MEQINFAKAIINRKIDFELHKKSVCYESYDDFFKMFNSFQLPDHWNKIIDSEKVTLPI